jgi:glycosyltransferase involved in cell wall biosynthesis
MSGNLQSMVSCVIPVFNGENFLAEAIESVLAQTHSSLEVIVVDDGSTDGSADVARDFADRGVRLLSQNNAGCASARNLGIAAASGDYVALLDADDLWLPDKLERQLVVFDGRPLLGACMTYMQNFWEPEYADEALQNPRLGEPQPGVASCFMARRVMFDEIGLLDRAIAHRDIQEWVIRAKQAGWQVQIMPDVLVNRRIHGENESRRRLTGESELLDMASKLIMRKRSS